MNGSLSKMPKLFKIGALSSEIGPSEQHRPSGGGPPPRPHSLFEILIHLDEMAHVYNVIEISEAVL